MLLRGIALLLLFTQQSWAVIICHCVPKNESQHACCLTARHSEHTAGMHYEDADTHTSGSCLDERSPASDDDLSGAPQGTGMCCQLAQQAEIQAISISLSNPLPAENSLSVLNVALLMASAPEYIGILQPPRSRPLYLTHSSLLI